jgi:hypothetical protein
LIDCPHLHRNNAEDDADGAALLEHVAAETAQPWHAVGEVHFLRVLELLPVRLRHDRGGHFDHVLVIQFLAVRDRDKVPVHASHRQAAHLQVEVGRAHLDG